MAAGSNSRLQLNLLLAAKMTLYYATALDVKSSWTYPSDNIKGRSAILNCAWTTSGSEEAGVLNIEKNDTSYFSCNVYRTNSYSCTKNVQTSPDRFTTSNGVGNISMTIGNLECLDEATYSCQVILFTPAGQFQQADTLLRIKIPPSSPALTIDQTEVIENSNINVSCTATLGYPNVGQIVWKTYQNGILFTSSPSDIVTSSTNVVQPGDDTCTVRNRSSVLLKTSRNNPNVSLACFVINQDFPPPSDDSCNNPTAQWCNLTATVNIVYPVSNIQSTIVPSTALYEGDDISLRCSVEANPLPTFTWTKVDDNRILTSKMDGLVSVLRLTNLNLSTDAGDYNCTAFNVVKGVTYTTSRMITLIINKATAPVPTTTNTQNRTVSPAKTTPKTESPTPDSKVDVTDTNSDKVTIIAMGVILSAIIVVQFVVILILSRSQGNCPCMRKLAERKPHIYDVPERPTHMTNALVILFSTIYIYGHISRNNGNAFLYTVSTLDVPFGSSFQKCATLIETN
ncbi:cell surface glycoprotein MUC18 [Biomphalaria pfeifferi]|uniref:Cell surface glycoprotein MUC18 n=1 Tax=Biomphalaria pfeifferi TaxID=112525 RepID=A0AAD8C6J4_BIOPF|nr:cell surface glycoprotein MUC18 [Biomphalaria pfeifferi]